MEKHLIYFIERKEGKESEGRGALVGLVKQRKKTAMAMQMQMQMQLKFQDQSSRRLWRGNVKAPNTSRTRCVRITRAVSRSNGSGSDASASSSKKGGGGSPGGVPQSNYFVPLDKTFSSAHSSWMSRPLVEILRDLNKRIPDNIIIKSNSPKSTSPSFSIPWYHANRMLSFYAPGWCGEIRDVIYAENGTVTVVYRVTIRGSDGEAYRESSGTISSTDANITDPVAAAEEMAFCRACARFGLGLYLYHEE